MDRVYSMVLYIGSRNRARLKDQRNVRSMSMFHFDLWLFRPDQESQEAPSRTRTDPRQIRPFLLRLLPHHQGSGML